MVKSAKDWICDNVSGLFDWPSAGRVLPERNVRPRLIVIGSVFRKDSSKVLDIEHEQMIRALAPDRTDQAFNIAILPGRAIRRGPVPDPHCSHTSLECKILVCAKLRPNCDCRHRFSFGPSLNQAAETSALRPGGAHGTEIKQVIRQGHGEVRAR